MKRHGLAIALLLEGAVAASAADHCVRPGATGDGSGSDWTNACPSLPSALARGDTYYLADGAYGSHVFADAPSGTAAIRIRKATATGHGTAAGWDSAFGSGQAVFSGVSAVWEFDTGFYDLDGIVGSSTGSYGIKVLSTGSVENTCSVVIPYAADASYLSFRHIEFTGAPTGTRVFWSMSSPAHDLYFEGDYFHGGRVWLSLASSSVVIERNRFADAVSTDPALHGAGIVMTGNGVTVRYNLMQNAIGAMTAYIEPQGADDITIHGNIFVATDPSEGTSQGIFAITSSDVSRNVKIYDNTVYGLHGSNPGVWSGNVSGSDVAVWNNLWQSCANVANLSGSVPANTTSCGSNMTDGGAVFVDAAGLDFHLAAETSPGTILAPPFDRDPDGIARGGGAGWDIGAYEFAAGGNVAPVVAMAIPDQTGTVGIGFSYGLPTGAFDDADGDTLAWSVSALPAGLSFTASTRVVGGTPTATGASTVTVSVDDGHGHTASTTFSIAIKAANVAPVVATIIPNQTSSVGTAFRYIVPSTTFTDPDGDGMTWSVSDLPAGLSFNITTRMIFGTPTAVEAPTITISVNDGHSHTNNTTFKITVVAAEGGGGNRSGASGGGSGGGCGFGSGLGLIGTGLALAFRSRRRRS